MKSPQLKNIEASKASHRKLLEYWETCDARQGGIVDKLSEKGLRICSHIAMPVGEELKMGIFFSLGHGFDECRVLTKITEKKPCWNGCWEAYNYEFRIYQHLQGRSFEIKRSPQDSAGKEANLGRSRW